MHLYSYFKIGKFMIKYVIALLVLAAANALILYVWSIPITALSIFACSVFAVFELLIYTSEWNQITISTNELILVGVFVFIR